jgi:uncharacterized phiE125 gp8 family phage protein
MNLRIVTQALLEPFTLAQARAHLNVDAEGSPPAHEDDALIEILLTASREAVEQFTSRVLVDVEYELRVDRFSAEIDLPVAPVKVINSITYIDGNGATQTLATSVYEFDDHPDYPKVRLAYGQTWPTIRGDANGVRIRFDAGYTDNDSPNTNPMPKGLQAALLTLLRHWYENREAVIVGSSANEIPMGTQYMMMPHRLGLGV